MGNDLTALIRQYQIERDLCQSAPTLEALLYWWGKWARTTYQLFQYIAHQT